jgi:clusterin-associated protein 1
MLISNNKGMEEKIRKRRIDLERNNKRLESLTFQTVRPAFMDEYEQIEKELQVEYERYVVRFRNVEYLEQELQSRRALAEERAGAERSVKRMQRKYRQEELAVLEGRDRSDSADEVRAQSSDSRGKENSKPRENVA